MKQDAAIIPDWVQFIEDAEDEALARLGETLSSLDGPTDESGDWPDPLWQALVQGGARSWSLPESLGGAALDRVSLLGRYARVAEGSLTAAFILSQHDAAVRRLLAAGERGNASRWLARIARGEVFATVGISHLTTSRRLGDRPMVARPVPDGFVLNGTMPWVTAAERAQVLVSGGVLDDGRQILVAIPAPSEGLTVVPAFPLAALQASRTTEVLCKNVAIGLDDILSGPSADVMAHPGAAGTGGLETTALALGMTRAILVAFAKEAEEKPALREPLAALVADWMAAWKLLAAATEGLGAGTTPGQVRGVANDLVLRASQAYLTARKGSGFLRSDPAQRWARQALFFLVWSCPGPVAQAAIRDLARVCSE